jgi:DNA repair protein RadC
MAIYEITYTRRLVSDETPEKLTGPVQASSYLMRHCFKESELWREEVYAIYLDSGNNVIGHALLAIGGYDSARPDIRLLAKAALDSGAAGVILAHNHPSGDPRPGQSDIKVTCELRKGLNTLGVTLIDHVVIGDRRYFSFSEEIEGIIQVKDK